MAFFVTEIQHKVFYFGRIAIHYFTGYLSSGQLFDHQGGPLEHIERIVRIHASFETVRSIGVQTHPAGGFSHPDRVEISTFQKHFRSLFRYARIQAAENTGHAHAFFGVADHQVLSAQLTFHTVEGYKRSALGQGTNHHFVPLYFGRIEGVQRLTGFV